MPRTIWKGHISFGLVEIPVGLYPALSPDELSFSLLDRRDVSPVGYRRVNKSTGEEVPKEEIAKGYEIERDRYVLLDDDDFRRANVESTRTIDILHFVDGASIDPRLFDKPYYVAPLRRGSKAYALLRASLQRSGKVGIARVVMRSRQYLAAVMVHGKAIVIEVLRYPHELRSEDELELPDMDLEALGVRESEMKMAERLIEELSEPFAPSRYRDEYRDDLLALIEEKAKKGATEEVRPVAGEEAVEPGEPVDLMALLERSINLDGDGAGVERNDGRGRGKAERRNGRAVGPANARQTKTKKGVGEGGAKSRGEPGSNGGKRRSGRGKKGKRPEAR